MIDIYIKLFDRNYYEQSSKAIKQLIIASLPLKNKLLQ